MNPHDLPDDQDPTQLLPVHGPVGAALAGEALAPGARLGHFQIESLLGRGGMGEVYRAEQLQPVRRTVALKLLRQQRMDVRNLAYFEVERQMLAQMRHPAIAQIFDAGATAEGFPYFAMEFIDGTPVTRYCQDHALTLRQRIELFIRICQGVQHAHHKGVIHRDLKPGNILVDEVDGRPLPKIIDFGIATATSRALGGVGLERAGTPDYMSPEQAGDDPAAVDTRSDVYSLGVVLYELLAGRRPQAAHETIVADQATTLRRPSEQLQDLPSAQAQQLARAQGLSRSGMRHVLRNELDWVVLKAMAYDRNDRYASAAEFAQDLQRFLDGRPVLAAPASRRYVWGKFMRRHRVALAAGGVVVVALLTGLGVSIFGLMQARQQRAIAEQRSAELEKVAAFQQSMLEGIDIEAMGMDIGSGLRDQVAQADPADVAAVEQALGHASTADLARGLIDQNILENAEHAITRDFTGEPALAANLRQAVARVRHALGLYEEAAEGFRQVADYRASALGKSAPDTLAARRDQANSLVNAAKAGDAKRVADAALLDAGALPPNDRVRIQLQMEQSYAIAALGDRPGAIKQQQALYALALATYGERDPLSMRVQEVLATTQAQSGDLKAARAQMEKLVPLSVSVLGADDKATLISTGTLAAMRAMTGDLDGALALQKGLVVRQIARLGNEHPVTLTARGNLVNMLMESGRAEDAKAEAEAVVEARTRVLGADHPQTLRSMLNLATLYTRLEDFDKALSLQRSVIDARVRLLGPRHPDTLSIMINHAGSLENSGQPAAALKELQGVLPLAREVLEPGHPLIQSALMVTAHASQEVGDLPAAVRAYREVLAIRVAQAGKEDAQTIDAAWQLSKALGEARQLQESIQLRTQYVAPLLSADEATLKPNLARLADSIRDSEKQAALR